MKITKIHIEKGATEGNLLFADQEFKLSYEVHDGNNISEKTHKSIVFIGENGTGKTTLLNTIAAIFENKKDNDKYKKDRDKYVGENTYLEVKDVEISGKEHEGKKYDGIIKDGCFHIKKDDKDIDSSSTKKVFNTNELKNKFVWIPLINDFRNVFKDNKSDYTDKLDEKSYVVFTKYCFSEYGDIKHIIFNRIDEIVAEKNITKEDKAKELIEKINVLFKSFMMSAKLCRLDFEKKELYFQSNTSKDEFTIDRLSSGEKNLFIRIFILILLNIENSIIMIDEPELSMHPKWQQKVLGEVYEEIGNNNQIIIATHSPMIVSSVDKRSVKVLIKRFGNKVFIQDIKEKTDKVSIDTILTSFMGLSSIRDDDTTKELKKLYEEIEKGGDIENITPRIKALQQKIGAYDLELSDIIRVLYGNSKK